ncbi:DNA polymerase I [Desulfovibrio mangrovi]|uniref:DNA polymerase I n=1 Tax=Desulfovibrio mangrovi TaxID=2976983 RepID=UPI0022472F89|nr:DNA polymerase I [Desulfovibrio mangrovi]UZP65798.1 DNA polymerase I [Desulfovibrio mangrovi]
MSVKERLGLTTEPLYLMDGSAFIFRAFYAMQSMQRSDGFPTNALFIVTRILLKFLKDEQPTYFGFILDGRGKNFRHETYPEYKANRSATPEPLVQQLDPIKQAVQTLGLHLEVSENCEADDCIASLAARYKKERPVIIIGADKDLKQCLDDNVFMWDPGAKQEKLTTLAEFREETGLEPAQWPDFQAIIGDSSDNIPGVPGIGPKTAEKIFADYPSLEAIRDNFDALAPTLQKKFADHLENMFTFRTLTTLSKDQCTSLTLDHFHIDPMDGDKAAAFLREYELRALLKEVAALAPVTAKVNTPASDLSASGKPAGGSMQLGLFDAPAPAQSTATAGAAPATAAHGSHSLKLADTTDATALPDCSGKRIALVPIGEMLKKPECTMPSLLDMTSNETRQEACIVNVLVEGSDREYRYSGSLTSLAGYASRAEKVIAPDVKALLAIKSGWRTVDSSRWFDLGLAAYLLDPEDRDYSWRRLSARADEFEIAQENPALLAFALADDFMRRLQGADLVTLMNEMELPLIRVLADMEEIGIHIDGTAFTAFLTEVQRELDRLTKTIYEAAGGQFNIRSAQQLGDLLFNKLGLKPKGKTKGGQVSTSQAVLEKLAGEHEVIDLILEYRTLEKLRSTYLEPMPRLADAQGRIHTTFNQLATATGRLSSSNPNLQNIPVRGQFGPRMRACFTARKGCKLVSADYSQIELRVLAHCSQDPTLLEAFRNDQDIHSSTASVLFDAPTAEVTPDQRRNAKTINFGLVYGMGPQKLAQELKISLNEAKEFIERYFAKLQQLKAFYEQVEADAKEHGYVTTLTGRRRNVPEIQSGNNQMQSQARRQAINTVIQGSAADIIKIAMLRTAQDAELKALKARLVLQVHDELLLEVPTENAEAAAKRLADIMSGVHPGGKALDVPLKVDYGIGDGWHEAH